MPVQELVQGKLGGLCSYESSSKPLVITSIKFFVGLVTFSRLLYSEDVKGLLECWLFS